MKKSILVVILMTSLFASAQKRYMLDKNHARLGFSVTHFGISHIEGNFKNFDVVMTATKDDFSDAQIELTANIGSINTDNEMRDKDLKSSNWFDAEKYPELKFKSKSFKKTSGNKYLLSGDLTVHGVTKSVSLDVTFNGQSTNPMNKKTSVGFTVNGKLDRTNFSVGAATSPVGKEVELKANVEFTLE